jgi:hypothetical protein
LAEEESFKVTDRRHRDTVEPGPETTGRPASPQPGAQAAAPPPPPRDAPSGPDLSGLFMMFASSALIGLGEADPMTGEREVDLAQAREAVDILLLLRDKTEGNRTEVESRLLEDVLYDLEMRFLQVANRADR